MAKLKENLLRLIALAVCFYATSEIYFAITEGTIYDLKRTSIVLASDRPEFLLQILVRLGELLFFGVYLLVSLFDQRLAAALRALKEARRR